MSIFGVFAGSPKKRNELPKDFAEQILRNDINLMLSKFTDNVAISNLTQLYMKGIEFYESQKDQSSEYFKFKLNSLMNNPTIISPKKKEDPQIQTKKLEFKVHTLIENIQPFEIPQQQQIISNTLTTKSNEVRQMIDNLKQETNKINQVLSKLHQIIQNDLNSQQNKIVDRIHKRNKSYINQKNKEVE